MQYVLVGTGIAQLIIFYKATFKHYTNFIISSHLEFIGEVMAFIDKYMNIHVV